jgi:hypothetical protein
MPVGAFGTPAAAGSLDGRRCTMQETELTAIEMEREGQAHATYTGAGAVACTAMLGRCRGGRHWQGWRVVWRLALRLDQNVLGSRAPQKGGGGVSFI